MSRRCAAYRAGFTVAEIVRASGVGSSRGFYQPYGFLSREKPSRQPCADCQERASECMGWEGTDSDYAKMLKEQ